MKFLLLVLLVISIFSKNNDKAYDISTDIVSGAMNGINNGLKNNPNLADKIANYAKAGTEVFLRKEDYLIKECIQRRNILKEVLKYSIDEAEKLSALKQLTSPTFMQDTAKLIEKKGGDAFIYLGSGFHKASELVGNSLNKAIKFIPYISAAYNGYNSIKRLSEGDIVGASLKLAEATVSFIPGLSFGQTLIPTAIDFIYNLSK